MNDQVQSPIFHDISLEPVDEVLRVFVKKHLIAHTKLGYRVIGAEPYPLYYFPAIDIDMDTLFSSERLECTDWSGDVCYFHASINGILIKNIAWFHPNPPEPMHPIKNYIGFFAQLIDDAWVGSRKVLTGSCAKSAGWDLADYQQS